MYPVMFEVAGEICSWPNFEHFIVLLCCRSEVSSNRVKWNKDDVKVACASQLVRNSRKFSSLLAVSL